MSIDMSLDWLRRMGVPVGMPDDPDNNTLGVRMLFGDSNADLPGATQNSTGMDVGAMSATDLARPARSPGEAPDNAGMLLPATAARPADAAANPALQGEPAVAATPGPTAPPRTGAFTQTVGGVPNLRFNVLTTQQTGDKTVGDLGEVTTQLGRLPPGFLKTLRDKGGNFVLVPTYPKQAEPYLPPPPPNAEAAPDLTNRSSATWYDGKTMVIGTPGQNRDRSFNATLHEVGHFWDFGHGYRSYSQEFIDAYDRDTPGMTFRGEEDEKKGDPYDDSYYLPDPEPAHLHSAERREDAYAEAFARYFGGDLTLKRDWPHIYEYFRSKLPAFAPEAPGRAFDPDRPWLSSDQLQAQTLSTRPSPNH